MNPKGIVQRLQQKYATSSSTASNNNETTMMANKKNKKDSVANNHHNNSNSNNKNKSTTSAPTSHNQSNNKIKNKKPLLASLTPAVVQEPGKEDVLMGRESLNCWHQGTIRFLKRVDVCLAQYEASKGRGKKMELIQDIYNATAACGGRFLTKDPNSDGYLVLSEASAKKKTGYIIRYRKRNMESENGSGDELDQEHPKKKQKLIGRPPMTVTPSSPPALTSTASNTGVRNVPPLHVGQQFQPQQQPQRMNRAIVAPSPPSAFSPPRQQQPPLSTRTQTNTTTSSSSFVSFQQQTQAPQQTASVIPTNNCGTNSNGSTNSDPIIAALEAFIAQHSNANNNNTNAPAPVSSSSPSQAPLQALGPLSALFCTNSAPSPPPAHVVQPQETSSSSSQLEQLLQLLLSNNNNGNNNYNNGGGFDGNNQRMNYTNNYNNNMMNVQQQQPQQVQQPSADADGAFVLQHLLGLLSR